MAEFEPKILGFFCNWCTSAAADLAGTSRIHYPPNVRPIRVWCSGTVDPAYIIRGLLEGADAVVVGGCHPGDCHYISGNYKARRRVKLLKTIFEALGLEHERIYLKWISASEGVKFAREMTAITNETKERGPNTLVKKWNV
ncbi:MAG TPA: hydrogenase iron-sulfur subunit [candidate division WOR-3 bacterium]|uniref:Hydrogenase iron-sulfur subunit n=1 Tax=candidate division WOR-3 bacterium TaxID=2052148 RepID=A0A7C0ZKT5_UNCW3|nr:hydrogenase iron-sulfur subunit [candidate division WOR-3 bacterium]